MDYGKLIEYAGRISVGVLLILILFAGSQGFWVYGSQYREAIAERDTWKELALKGTKVASQAVQHNRALTGPPPVLPSLPKNPSPQSVNAALEFLNQQSKFVTEPEEPNVK